MMRIRYTAFVLLAGLFLAVTNVYAVDFYGADVTDSDVPSSYLKIGLFGFRPIVGTVTFDSPADKHGFQRGDIIFSINGKDIKRSSELKQFATGVLSVTIFRCKEKMTVTMGSPAHGMAQTKPIAVKKQSAAQRQITHDVPVAVAVVNSPPAKFDDRAVVPPAPVRREVPLTHDKQAQTKRAAAEKVPNTDCTGGPEKCGPGRPTMMPSHALPSKGDIFSRAIKPAQDQIVFENTRGDVVFSHSIHLRSLNQEQCMLCHGTGNHTHESIQSRLGNYRAAHGFCRGCHQKTGKEQSAECQACHDKNKKG
jgi:membrane-associated protease RseP (regulator of RpoE activity)